MKKPCPEHLIATKKINSPLIQAMIKAGYKATYCPVCKFTYLEKHERIQKN